PILLAFLFYLAKRRIFGVLAAAFLSGQFYPHMALIIGGLLATCLFDIHPRGRLRLALDNSSRSLSLFGLLAVAGGLAPFALRMGGDALSRATAMSLPSLHPGGRSSFFVERMDWFLLCNERSGLLPVEWGCHSLYGLGSDLAPVLAAGLLTLALVPSIGLLRRAAAGGLRERERFALTIPVRVIFVSVVGFVAAHLMLFDLHLPSRFGQYPLRAITFVALVALAGPLLNRGAAIDNLWRRWLGPVLALLAALALVPFPFVPRPEYVEITRPGLHAALAELPRDTVIVALGDEADNIPSVAARSVFVSREYLIPWSEAFGAEMRRRMNGLVEAVYTTDGDHLRMFGETEGIGAFVLAAEAFSLSYLNGLWWKIDFPEAHKMALERVRSGSDFVLGKISEDCPDVRRVDGFTIVPASCWR
ncbi:MAG: hypothetical protein MI741_13430, partial [Rhodospirillales bacterium]|nr:hypothetical protein [Rhodospirillales bacterium]